MGLKKSMTLMTLVLSVMLLFVTAQTVMAGTKNQASAKAGKQVQSVLSGKIDINSATVEILTQIKGIGEKKAQSIIDYREKNGPFKSVDDLVNVKGIGEKSLEKYKKHLTVS